jgi:glucokinase
VRGELLGIEIGGTKLQLFVADSAGEVLEKVRLIVAPNNGAAGIRAQIEATGEMLRDKYRLNAVAIAFGGPINWKTGQVARSHQIEGWSGFDLRRWAEELFPDAKILTDNDTNIAALGEALRGAGQGRSPVFYTNLGSGLGGGLILKGRIYHGMAPGEAEIGHVRLDRSGATLESQCCGWAVDRRIRQLNEKEPQGLLAQLCRGQTGGEARHLLEAIEQGDRAARGVLQETTETMAFALSHVVHLFHPEVIVVGGGLSLIGEPLRAGIEHALPQFLMEVFRPGPPVRLAGLGEDVVPIGALELARQVAQTSQI